MRARAGLIGPWVVSLLLAGAASAQDLTPADMTLAGMQLGTSRLDEVLSRFGLSPLRQGEVDELCYRSESPLQAAWVLFGSGDEGGYEKLTQFRVLSTAPAGVTCPPSARLTRELGTESGIRLGMPADQVKPKLGPRLRITVTDGKVGSFEIRLRAP